MFNPLSSKAPCERSEASSERRWDWSVSEEKGTRTGKEAVERHRECKALNMIRSFCLLQVQCPLGHWSVLSGLTKKEIQKRLRLGFLTKTHQGCSWICSLTSLSFLEFGLFLVGASVAGSATAVLNLQQFLFIQFSAAWLVIRSGNCFVVRRAIYLHLQLIAWKLIYIYSVFLTSNVWKDDSFELRHTRNVKYWHWRNFWISSISIKISGYITNLV